jgi:hypothetical protein
MAIKSPRLLSGKTKALPKQSLLSQIGPTTSYLAKAGAFKQLMFSILWYA